MLLQLLNIERYINENKLMEVKSFKTPFKSYDKDGLWSEVIFGPIGSKTRSERFGYIDLKHQFIHPIVFDLVSTVSDQTSKIVREKSKFIVKDGKYIESVDGETGINFLINTFNEIKFQSFCHSHKLESAKYLDENKHLILISKFLVTPASNRDVDIYNKKGGKLEIEPINEIYAKLLIYLQQITEVEDIDSITNRKIQIHLNNLIDYIKKRKLTGKKGLFRGTMLRKSMDYSTRLVLTNDPDIKLGTIGLPWHTLVAIYEPFVIHNLFKKEENLEILNLLKVYTKNESFDYSSFSKFVKDLILNPEIIPITIKTGLISLLNQFLPDQVVMCKRDPVVQRKSWFSAIPTITEGRVAYVNSMDLGPMGGDCVKGNIITYIKNENHDYIQHIESIDEFYKNHKLILIEKQILDTDVEIYDFLIDEEIYSIGINEETKELQYSKIQRWSIHNNINLFTMNIDNSKIIISEHKSCYIFNGYTNKFKKYSINELLHNSTSLTFKHNSIYNEVNNKLFFIKYSDSGYNNKKLIDYISINNTTFKKYINKLDVNIQIGDILINSTEDNIAYDLTMDNENIRSFLHSSMILQCNSDGDTVAVFPVFTDEAKEEVRIKMNPTLSKTKWKDVSTYNGVIYAPTLDAIATIYSATL